MTTRDNLLVATRLSPYYIPFTTIETTMKTLCETPRSINSNNVNAAQWVPK